MAQAPQNPYPGQPPMQQPGYQQPPAPPGPQYQAPPGPQYQAPPGPQYQQPPAPAYQPPQMPAVPPQPTVAPPGTPMQQPPYQQPQAPAYQPPAAPATPAAPQQPANLPNEANLAFNPQDPSMGYQDEPGFNLPPAGDYNLRIEKYKTGMTSTNKPQVIVDFTVADGPHQNKRFRVWFQTQDSTQHLRGLLDAAFGDGQGWDRNTNQFGHMLPHLPGRIVLATLIHDPGSDPARPFARTTSHRQYAGPLPA